MTARALRPLVAAPAGLPANPPPMQRTVRARRRWDPLLICLAVYILTAVGRIHQLFPPLGAAKPLLLASLFGLIFYVADRSAARRLAPVLRSRTTRWVLAFLVWAGLSVISALRPGEAMLAFLDALPKTVLMFVLLVAAVREWKDVERLAGVYFASVAIYAAVVLLRFDIVGDKWRLAQLYYYDANDFATLTVTALPLGLYFAVSRRRWLPRLLVIAGTICMLLTFLRTGSRGGFLALMAVSVFLLLRYRAIRPAWRLGATAAVLIVLAATGSREYWDRMNSILHPESDYNVSNPWGRVQVWERGIQYMFRFPFFGVGYANFSVAEGTLFRLAVEMESRGKGAKWGVAHNSFIQAGAELGIPGLMLFIGILVSAGLAAWRVRTIPGGPQGPPRLAQSIVAALIGFAVGSFFLTLTYSDMIFVLAGLSTALAKTTRLARRPAKVALRG